MPLAAPPIVSAYKSASRLASALPAPTADLLGRLAGTGAAVPAGARRMIVERNLERAHGRPLTALERRRGVRNTFESYARYWVETFRLPRLSLAELDAGMSYEGYEHIARARRAGRGTILVVPHLGGWEWGAFWFSRLEGFPITAVVERLEPPELYEWFVDLRTRLGMNIVPLGPSAATEVIRAVKRGDVVTLLSDRDVAGGGVPVEFFGERTTLPAGPATLALRTGAELLPTAVYFDGPGHHGVVQPPVPVERRGRLRDDVERVTQDVAQRLEELIRAAPDQWHLMSPNWPSDHDALRRAGYR